MRFAMPLLVAFYRSRARRVRRSGTASRSRSRSDRPAEDAPGSKPDPVETRQTDTVSTIHPALSDFAVDPDEEEIEMTKVFQEGWIQGSGVDLRSSEETHRGTAPHVVSSLSSSV